MRMSRIEQCPKNEGLVHKTWKCHNGEMLLKPSRVKKLYFEHTRKAIKHKSVGGQVGVKAFCYMDNHVHMLCEYHNGLDSLSNFMRIAHSGFGFELNRKLERRGKVAIERPYTPLVEQGSDYERKAQFYIEANPLRARMVSTLEELRQYQFSSFAYYAYGDVSPYTQDLVEPQWYIALGANARERQRRYRELFRDYLDKEGWFGKVGERENPINIESSSEFQNKHKVFVKTFRMLRLEHRELGPREILKLMANGPPY